MSEQERMTLSIEEAAALLGISRALAYELVRLGYVWAWPDVESWAQRTGRLA